MTTLDCYESLRRCFGEGWEPGVTPNKDVEYWSPSFMLSERGGMVYLSEQHTRAILLSAALEECARRGMYSGFGAATKRPLVCRVYPRGRCDGQPHFDGHGPDTLSRLADALSKWKEAQ